MKIKKIYISPNLVVVSLDRCTSLSMLSEYTEPGDPFETSGSAQSAPIEEEQSVKKSAFTDSPFGETFE